MKKFNRCVVELVASALGLIVGSALSGCAPHPRATAAPAVPIDLDHVVVAVSNFTRGVGAIEMATGTVLDTGWQAPRGTGGADVGGDGVRAALLALDHGRYLELVGPQEEGFASRPSALAQLFAPYQTPTPIGWAVRTSDVDSVRRVLSSRALHPGLPRSGILQAPTASAFAYRAVEGWPGVTTLMPFFVQWAAPTGSPAPSHAAQCVIERLGLAFYAPDSLAKRIAVADVHVAVSYSDASIQGIRLTLRCPAGVIEFPARAS